MKIFFNAFLPCLLLILFGSTSLYCQVTAGSVPPGTSIVYDLIDLSIVEDNHDTMAYFDIDGDGTQDIRIWFLKEYPPADGPNTVAFFVLKNSFSFCTDTGHPERASYFNFGDTLCTIGHEWGVDSLYTIGCFGGWNCTYDTASINNKYIAYRKTKTGEIGWINVSMSLYSGNEPRTITFKINELLALYLANGTGNVKNDLVFDVIPNPSIDGRFEIISHEIIADIEIFNSAGQRIKSGSKNDMDLSLPESKGLYIVRIKNEKGQSGSRRVIRL